MTGILVTKFRLFIRNPWLFIIMTVVCMMFAFFIGKVSGTKVHVPVYSELSEEETNPLLDELNESDLFTFEGVSKLEMNNAVQKGNAEMGLHIGENDFSVFIATESANVHLLKQYVQSIYSEYLAKTQLLRSFELEDEKENVEQIWDEALKDPIFVVEQRTFRNSEANIINMQLQGIFGFSLFFVIYTIAFNVIQMLEEKRDRIWDRMIVTSVKKWELYVGNLLYIFIIGYFQVVLIFATFRFGAGVNFNGGFGKTLIILIPYVLTIVAFCMVLAGLSKSVSHFNALVPLFSVVFAMLGGAYWPIEIVTSDMMLFLSNLSPIKYGMEALKGATIYHYSYSDLLSPISILVLMMVIMMGVGINLMEKRNI